MDADREKISNGGRPSSISHHDNYMRRGGRTCAITAIEFITFGLFYTPFTYRPCPSFIYSTSDKASMAITASSVRKATVHDLYYAMKYIDGETSSAFNDSRKVMAHEKNPERAATRAAVHDRFFTHGELLRVTN